MQYIQASRFGGSNDYPSCHQLRMVLGMLPLHDVVLALIGLLVVVSSNGGWMP